MGRFDPLFIQNVVPQPFSKLGRLSLDPLRTVQKAMAPFESITKSASLAGSIGKISKSYALPESLLTAAATASKWSEMGSLGQAIGLTKLMHAGPAFEAATAMTRLQETIGLNSLRDIHGLSALNATLMPSLSSVHLPEIIPVTAIPPRLPTLLLRRHSVLKDVHVACAFCGEELSRSTRQTEEEVTVKVVPLCGTCQRRWQEDPDYMSRELRKFTGPRLTVIEGGAEVTGDLKRTGHLRLLPPPSEHEEDLD